MVNRTSDVGHRTRDVGCSTQYVGHGKLGYRDLGRGMCDVGCRTWDLESVMRDV